MRRAPSVKEPSSSASAAATAAGTSTPEIDISKPATLVVASSLPVRALEWCMAPRDGVRVLANRGANGIDGFTSTVVGVAQACVPGPTVGLCGDLCFLHDTNGLLGASGSATIVVIDNDGGGIFSYLPPAELPEFEELFDAAQYAYPLTEDHAFYIDQMGVVLFRRFTRAVGAALARNGCIADGDDIFFLHVREVRNAMANGNDYKELVEQRKQEYEACAQASPPDILGTPPPPPQPGDFVDPFIDAVTSRLLGIKAPPEGDQDPDLIDGVAGSPGVYTGVARVVRTTMRA